MRRRSHRSRELSLAANLVVGAALIGCSSAESDSATGIDRIADDAPAFQDSSSVAPTAAAAEGTDEMSPAPEAQPTPATEETVGDIPLQPSDAPVADPAAQGTPPMESPAPELPAPVGPLPKFVGNIT